MKSTKNLKLNLPEPNDSVRVLENITENFEKIDAFLELMTPQEAIAIVEKYKAKEWLDERNVSKLGYS